MNSVEEVGNRPRHLKWSSAWKLLDELPFNVWRGVPLSYDLGRKFIWVLRDRFTTMDRKRRKYHLRKLRPAGSGQLRVEVERLPNHVVVWLRKEGGSNGQR
jgi:hypothetical protein